MSLTDAQRREFERRLRAAFLSATAGQADALLRLLGEPPDVTNIPDSYWAGLAPKLLAEIGPVLVEMAVKSALGLGEDAGAVGAVNWQLVNERAARWASRYSFELVKGINATSAARLQKLVDGFIRDGGKDLKALGVDIGKVFGEARGNAIAVTEVTRAVNAGEQTLVNEIKRLNPDAPVVQIWLTANDEIVRRCPICWPRHGKQRGDGWTDLPPAHVNCRCGISTQIALPEPANA